MRHVDTGSADQSIRVWVYDADGAAITGQSHTSAGIAASVVVRSAGRIVSSTALTLVARTSVGVHRDSAFTEVSGGEYVIDLPDSYFATANREVSVTLTSDAIAGGYVLSESLGVAAALATKSVVDSIAIALAGSAPVEPTGTTVFELLEGIQSSLTSADVLQVASPNVQGNLVLTQGDDYDGVANPRASWTVGTDYTSGWTVRLTIRDTDDNVVYTTTGSVVSATVVAVTIAAPTGLAMAGCPGQWQGKFDLELTHSTGKKKTIALGACYINEDQTRA